MTQPQNPLLGLSLQELTGIAEGLGQPAYRGRQLFEAIYSQRLGSLTEFTTLPQELRKRLAQQGFSLGLPKIEKQFQSRDGTIRYLIAFADAQSVETVWMPDGDGGESGDGSEAGDINVAGEINVAGDHEEASGWQAGKFQRATSCG